MTSNKLFALVFSLFCFAFIIAINEAAHDGHHPHHRKGPAHGHHSPHHKHHHHGGGGGNGGGKDGGSGLGGGKGSGGGKGDINANGGGSLKEGENGGQNVNGGGSLNGNLNVPDNLSLGDIEKAVGKLSSAEFGHILKQELSPGSVANVLAGISPKLAGDLITYVPKSDILAVFETISADTLKKLIEQESNPDLGSAGNIESISASQIPQIYAGLPNSTIGRIAAGFPNSVKAHLFANLPDKTVGEVAKHLPESIQVKAIEALSKSKIEELAGGESSGSKNGSSDSSTVNEIKGIPSDQLGSYALGLTSEQLGSLAANLPPGDLGSLLASLPSAEITSAISAIPDELPSRKANDTDDLTSDQLKEIIASVYSEKKTHLAKRLPKPVLGKVVARFHKNHLGRTIKGQRKAILRGLRDGRGLTGNANTVPAGN